MCAPFSGRGCSCASGGELRSGRGGDPVSVHGSAVCICVLWCGRAEAARAGAAGDAQLAGRDGEAPHADRPGGQGRVQRPGGDPEAPACHEGDAGNAADSRGEHGTSAQSAGGEPPGSAVPGLTHWLHGAGTLQTEPVTNHQNL